MLRETRAISPSRDSTRRPATAGSTPRARSPGRPVVRDPARRGGGGHVYSRRRRLADRRDLGARAHGPHPPLAARRAIEARATVALPDSFLDSVRVWTTVQGTMTVAGGFRLAVLRAVVRDRRARAALVHAARISHQLEDCLDCGGDAHLPLPPDQARFGYTVIGRVDRPPTLEITAPLSLERRRSGRHDRARPARRRIPIGSPRSRRGSSPARARRSCSRASTATSPAPG